MARIEKEVTMVKESSYERRTFSGYGYETVNIYKLSDGETTYVWKTTSSLVYEVVNENDDVEMYFPKKGVIIRAGRLKNSGTRGEKFAYYVLESDDGRVHTYKAVCEDNAIARAEKELGGNWCVKHIEDCYRGGWRDIWR